MDNLQLHEDFVALKKLREEYEDQLKIFGFELCDLPDDISVKLDECVELQMATQLHDLGQNYLQEFFYAKKKEAIDNQRTLAKMKAEIKQQEDIITKETEECNKLEKFITSTNKRLVSEAEMLRNKISLEDQMKNLENRQKNLALPQELNIDELMKKIDLLKSRSKPDGK